MRVELSRSRRLLGKKIIAHEYSYLQSTAKDVSSCLSAAAYTTEYHNSDEEEEEADRVKLLMSYRTTHPRSSRHNPNLRLPPTHT
mmetsp:Transcript_7373/g.8575  ORF Transcript_7373/g.8575 Transcript_7373/m.8575 type:complete len:85 (-) Transcript_7373:913-1167(-)